MKNLRRDNKKKSIENKFLKKKSFYFLTLLSILIAIFFSPKISIAEPSKAIIGPLSVLGQIPVTDQQILFNRFREQLNKGYHLISHKVIELIYDQGLKSIDIEDCTSSKCVRKVLIFIKKLKKKFDADDLYSFQLVQSKSDIQLTLKLSSLSTPEVTKNIVTQSCKDCDMEKLISKVDKLVQQTFSKIGIKEIVTKEIDVPSELDIDSEKDFSLYESLIPESIIPSKNSNSTEKVTPSEEEISSPQKDLLPKLEKIPEIAKEQLSEEPDPYIVDRDLYNQQIGKLLIDVTYALQIFRSGMFVQLEVSIDPSGTIVNQRIINSSGSEDFDETAIMTLEEIQFDPLPESMLKFGNYVVNLQIHNSR